MSILGRVVFVVFVVGVLGAVFAWPLAATLVQSARVSDRLGRALRSAGWDETADRVAGWLGTEGSVGGSGFVDPSQITGDDRVRPFWRLAGESARVVALSVAIALGIGVPVALLLFRTDLWGRRFLLALLALVAFVPLPLHATAWLGGFGNMGRSQAIGGGPLIVGWAGAAFVHAMAALPWIVVLCGVGFLSVERELEELAWLDRPGWRVLLGTTLRRSWGAIAAAALAVAVLTAGDMTVTDLLQIRTYAEESYVQYQIGDDATAAAVALPPMIVLGLFVAIGARTVSRMDPAKLASASLRAKVWELGRWRVPLGVSLTFVLGNLIAWPLYGLVWRAGRVGGDAAKGEAPHWSPDGFLGTMRFAAKELVGPGLSRVWRSPLTSSVLLAAIGATATVALAWCLAWACRRGRFWRGVTGATVVLALAVPGPVAGMALILAYRNWPDVYNSIFMVEMGYVLRTLPYALLVLWPAIRAVPTSYLEAATLDGLDEESQVRRIAFPLTRSATFAAWSVAFVLALGELPVTNLVVPPGATPLSFLVWSLLHTGVESHLAGVGLLLLGGIAVLGGTSAVLVRRAFRPGLP